MSKVEYFLPIEAWIASSTACRFCRAILAAFKKKYYSYIGGLDGRALLRFFEQNFPPEPLCITTRGCMGMAAATPERKAQNRLERHHEGGLLIDCIAVHTQESLEHFKPGRNGAFGFVVAFDLWVDDGRSYSR